MAVQTYSPEVISVTDPRDISPFEEMIEPSGGFVQDTSHSGLQSALHLISGMFLPT